MNTSVNKMVVAALMAAVNLLAYFGLDLGPDAEATVLAIASILTPIIVWLVPNADYHYTGG